MFRLRRPLYSTLRNLLLLFALMTVSHAFGQHSYTMTSSTLTIPISGTNCSGTIYDNGGANGDYSNNFSGWVVLVARPGDQITLSGNYNTESGYDKISVYDGYLNAGNLLVNEVGGENSLNVTSMTGYLSLYFHTDGSVTRSGFAFHYQATLMICRSRIEQINAYNISATSATIGFRPDTLAGGYTVMLNNLPLLVTDDTVVTLTPLSPNQRYSVRVTGDTSSGSCSAETTFRTLCGQTMEIPFYEGFDGYPANVHFPLCWATLRNYDNGDTARIVTSPTASGNGALALYCGTTSDANHYSMVMLPETEDVEISGLSVRFKMYASYSNTRIEVGVCEGTGRFDHNFRPIDTVTIGSTGTWETKIVSLAGYSGSGKRIAFRLLRGLQSGSNACYIDEISIAPCFGYGYSYTDRRTHSVRLDWQQIGTPVLKIEYGPQGFTPGTGRVVDVPAGSTFYRLDGLAPLTYYDVYFYSSCDGGAYLFDPTVLTVYTLNDVHVLPNYCEDFDASSSLPEGWRTHSSYVGTPCITYYYATTGNQSLQLSAYYNQYSAAVLPRVDSSRLKDLTLLFDAYSTTTADYAYLVIAATRYPYSFNDIHPIDTIHFSTSSQWIPQQISLSNHDGVGDYLMLIYKNTSSSSSIYIDRLRLMRCGVEGATVHGISDTSATLSWDTVYGRFEETPLTVEYGVAPLTAGEGTTIDASVEQGSVTLNGLAPGTSYDLILHTHCDSLYNTCAEFQYHFQTLDEPMRLPLCQDFESCGDSLPAGWRAGERYFDNPMINTQQHHSGTHSLRMRSSSNSNSIVVLPEIIDDSLQNLYYDYYFYNPSSQYKKFEIGVMTNPDDPSTFVAVGSNSSQHDFTWHTWGSFAGYNGHGRHIALRYSCNTNYYCGYDYTGYLDDIQISPFQIQNPTAYSLTATKATIQFEALGNPDSITLAYCPKPFDASQATYITLPATQHTVTLTALEPNTAYAYQLLPFSSRYPVPCTLNTYTFTTLESTPTLDFCENFDNGLPPGSIAPLSYSDYPRISTLSGADSRGQLLGLYTYNRNESWFALPLIEMDSFDGVALQCDYYFNGSTTSLVVGVMSNPTDTGTFCPMDTIPASVNYGSWNTRTIDFSHYEGLGRHIAFRLLSSSGNSGTVHIDNISVASCHLSDIFVSDLSPTSATLNFTLQGATDSVEVSYKLATDPSSQSTDSSSQITIHGSQLTNHNSQITIHNLSPDTRYTYSILAYCSGATIHCPEITGEFTTSAEGYGDGLCEDFESYENRAIPTLWTHLSPEASEPIVSRNQSNGGYGSLMFYSNTSTFNSLIATPYISDPLSSLVVSFDIRCENNGNNLLIIGALESTSDTADFTPLDTITMTNEWQHYDIPLSHYTGEGHYLLFFNKNHQYTCYSYLDNLQLSRSRATAFHYGELQDTCVTLYFSRIGDSADYILRYYRTDNPDSVSTIAIAGDQHKITINTLAPATEYFFALYTTQQDTSELCQAQQLKLTTFSEPLIPSICYDFDASTSTQLPYGWFTDGDVTITYLNGFGRTSQCIRLYRQTAHATAIMPAVAVDLANCFLEFDAAGYNASYKLVVGTMASPYDTASFVALDTLELNSTWKRYKIPLSTYSGPNRHIAFRAISPDWGYLYIDNVNIRSCILTDAQVRNTSQHHLNLHWSGQGTNGIMVEYRQGGDFTPGQGDTIIGFSSPLTIDSLQEGNNYTLHLYPVCDSIADGCNYDIITPQTLFPPVPIPYCENFDEYSDGMYPNTWWRHAKSNGTSNIYILSSRHHNESGASMTFEAGDTLSALAILPDLTSDESCITLRSLVATFWAYTDQSYSRLILGVVTDVNDPNTFQSVDTLTFQSTSNWQHFIIPLANYSGDSGFVAFKMVSGTGSYCNASIDDLCIETCVADSITISDITQHSVTVSWLSYGVDSLVCEYGPAGFDAGTGTLVTMTSNPYVIEGLDDGTDYQFAFASVCGCNTYGAVYRPGEGSRGYLTRIGSWGWCHRFYEGQWVWRWCWGSWNPHWGTGWGIGWGLGWGGGTGTSITTQADYLSIPYCQNFDRHDTIGFPPSWRHIDGNVENYPRLTRTNHHSGEECLEMYTMPGYANYASLPPVTPGSLRDLVMTFYAFTDNDNATNDNARFMVGVMTNPDDASTFVPFDTLRLNSTLKWQQFVVDFADFQGSPAATYYITFAFKPFNASYHMFVDDLYVGRCAVANVHQTVHDAGVSLSWDSYRSPERIEIEYGPAGFAENDSLESHHLSTSGNSVTLTNLDMDSTYEVYVMPHCDDSSSYCAPFGLVINPSIVLPYCQDFEGVMNPNLPDLWHVAHRGGGVLVSSEAEENRLYFAPGSGNNYCLVRLAPLSGQEPLGGKQMRWDMKVSNYSYTFLQLGYLTDTSDYTSFVSFLSASCSRNNTWQTFTVTIPTNVTASELVLKAYTTSSYRDLYVDNFMISRYNFPSNVRWTETGYAEKNIYWEGSGTEDYQIEYGAPYFMAGTGTRVASSGGHALLTGLAAGSTYDFRFVDPSGRTMCERFEFETSTPAVLPYCDDFEAGTLYSRPEPYHFISNNNTYPRLENLDGSKVINFYSSSSSNAEYMVFPEWKADSSSRNYIRFRMRVSNVGNGMVVGMMRDWNDESTFTPLDTLRNASSGVWEERIYGFEAPHEAGRFLAFKLFNQGSGRYVYIDEVAVNPSPIPTFSVAGAHRVKAMVGTNENDGSTSSSQIHYDYWVEVTSAEGAAGSGRMVHVTSNPFWIEGLDAETTYRFYAHPDSSRLSCMKPTLLTTAASSELPYCMDFDSYGTYTLPEAWKRLSSYSDYPYTTSSPYESPSRSLYFCARNTDYEIAVLPDLETERIADVWVQLSVYSYYRDQTWVEIGVMSDPTDPNTFAPVASLQPHSDRTWERFVCPLASYEGEGRFVAIRSKSSNSSRHDCYVDNVYIQSCPLPQVTLRRYNTLEFALADTLTADYWVEYAPGDFEQGEGTLVHITQPVAEIGGLEPRTTYSCYIRCDSTTMACRPAQKIATADYEEPEWCEDFNTQGNYGYPSKWKKFSNYGDYPYTYSNTLRFYAYDNSYTEYAILPDGDYDSVQQLTVSLSVYSDRNYIWPEIGVMDDPNDMNSFTPVASLRPPYSNYWTTLHVSLASYEGRGRYVALRQQHGNNGWSECQMDNLRVSKAPMPQMALVNHNRVEIITDSALTPDYWIEYGLSGFAQGSGTKVHVTHNRAVIDSLQDLTTYDFYAKADTNDVSCRPPITIQTSEVRSLPLCDNFDSYPDYTVPTGWGRISTKESYPRAHVYTYRSSRNSLEFFAQNSNEWTQYLILPELDVEDLGKIRISCWRKNYSTTTNALCIGAMERREDESSFVPLDTLRVTQNDVWQPKRASLASYEGSGKFVVIKLIGTQNSYGSYLDDLIVDSCSVPHDVTPALVENNVVRFEWSQPIEESFYIRYSVGDSIEGLHLVHPDDVTVQDGVSSVRLTLDYNKNYHFTYSCAAEGAPWCWLAHNVQTGFAPQGVPLCEGFEGYTQGALPNLWSAPSSSTGVRTTPHSGSNSLRLYRSSSVTDYAVLPQMQVPKISRLAISFYMRSSTADGAIEVGYMTSPSLLESFVPVRRFYSSAGNLYQRQQVVLSEANDEAHYVAFRTVGSGSSSFYVFIDDLYVDTCGASDFRITDIEAHEVLLEWNESGSPVKNIEYGPIGFVRGNGTQITLDEEAHGHYTVSGLQNLTNYAFYFSSSCGVEGDYCNTDYQDSAKVFTPGGGTGCIDPTSLTASYTTCFYGSYGNPYANSGVVDYGSSSPQSRHTVHYDTSERDARTGYRLRTVPPGAQASVRLGNWASNSLNPEAESVTYSLFVDSTAFDLLILRYAAVLQDPEHSVAQQPRFRLELLDSAFNLLDANCAAADFAASYALGWNLVAEKELLWKDWTTVGVDMSQYAGQNVFVRLTTYDCGEGSHFGYAYFTLGCMLKNVISKNCGNSSDNTFTAPDGFAYRWFTSADSATTFSSDQSITVPTNDTLTYFCDVSFVDNQACSFRMSAFAGSRYPLARYSSSTSIAHCKATVTLTNTSTISRDGITPLGTGERCESAQWVFENGFFSDSYHTSVEFDHSGDYPFMLIVGIANNNCTDTLRDTLHIRFNETQPAIVGPDGRCTGDSLTLAMVGSASHIWSNGSSDSLFSWTALTDTTIWCIATDTNGCVDTLYKPLKAYPSYDLHLSDTLCNNQFPYTWEDTTLLSPGQLHNLTYRYTTLSSFGCDSLRTLHLSILDTSTGDTTAVVCDSLVWWGTPLFASAEPTHILSNAAGCDSTVTLHLTVNYSTTSTLDSAIVENSLPLTWNGVEFTRQDTLQAHLLNSASCDSLVTMRLRVHPNVSGEDDSTVCLSQLPLSWNGVVFDSADLNTQQPSDVPLQPLTSRQQIVKTTTLISSTGSDSLLTLTLYVNPSYDLHLFDTLCNNQFPYTWEDTTLLSPGQLHNLTYRYATLSSFGCDSLRTLHLSILDTSTGDTAAVVCDSLVWWGTPLFASAEPTHRLSNVAGCDSTVTLHLTVHYSTTSTLDSAIVENSLPFTWNGVEFTRQDTLQAHLLNSASCDSLVTMRLRVHPNVSGEDDSTVCLSQLPLSWNGVVFDSADLNTQQPSADPLQPLTSRQQVVKTTTLTSHTGSDSLLTLTLYVNPSYDLHLYDSLCNNQFPYTWEDTTFLSPGQLHNLTYRYATLSSFGCDSLRTLHLSILDTSTGDTSAVVCDSLIWWGTPLFASAEPTHILSNVAGCDSTLTLHLTVHYSTTSTLDSAIVENSLPLTWNGVEFTRQDTLQAHLLNSASCDSLVTMRLRVHPNVSGEDDSTVCLSQLPLSWNGVVFDSADLTYLPSDVPLYPLTSRQQIVKTTTLTSHTGSDSLLTLTLYVNPSYDLHLYDTLCNNQFPYTWEDTTFLSPGQLHNLTYRYTTLSSFGCDSLRTLHLSILDTSVGDTTAVVCDSLVWWGTPLFASAEPTHRLSNTAGCDSTVTLHLTVHYSTTSTLDSAIVENSLPLTWNGVTFTRQDTLQAHLLNSASCDSLVTMRLRVHPNVSGEDDSTVCLSQLPLSWNGVVFDSADLTYLPSDDPLQPLTSRQQIVKTTTLTSHSGSDSLLTLTLYVNPSYDLHLYDTLCNNQFPYTWEDTTFLSPGQLHNLTYRYATLSSFGCDSLRTLHLSILDTSVGSFSDTVVENLLPYSFNGYSFNQSVTDSIVVISNNMGCDSVIHFSLTVHLNVSTDADSTVCLSQLPLSWNGVVFDSADLNTQLPSDVPLSLTKTTTLTSHTGSDSTVVMSLTVNPSYNFHLFDTLCNNQLPYLWDSLVFDAEGTQTRFSQTLLGCDSITHYTLTVFDTAATIDSVDQCQPLLWIDGQTYIRDTVGPQFTLSTLHGCDSLVTLSFRISHPSYTLIEDSLCRGNTYLFNGRTLTTGGIYFDTLPNVEGCDSITQLTLRELLPHEISFDVSYDCEDLSYSLSAITDARYTLWSSIPLSDEIEDQEQRKEITVHPSTPTRYTLYADYSEAPFCPSSKDLAIEPLVKPVAQIEAKPPFLSTEHLDFIAIDRSTSATERLWTINGYNFGSESSIAYSASRNEDSVIVTLMVNNATCADTDVVVIPIIHTDLFVPNVFTPGQTTNNSFSIVGKDILQGELQIYNREGLMVFSSSDPNTPWDGTHNGTPCSQGTYIYKFRYTLTLQPDTWHTWVGSVTLIR